jgi:hypothetical protein
VSAARLPLLALATFFAACSASADPIAPALDAAPPEPAPPCIHEVCGDRPRFLDCVATGITPARCDRFEIRYEWHCRCDTWGAAPRDGGP